MTRAQVGEHVDAVLAAYESGDIEAAHYTEDYLLCRFVIAIDEGTCVDPRGCARELRYLIDTARTRRYA